MHISGRYNEVQEKCISQSTNELFRPCLVFSPLHKFHKYKCLFLVSTKKYKDSVFHNLPMKCLDPVWSFFPLHKFHKYKCLFLVGTKKYKDSVFLNLKNGYDMS